MINNRKIGLFTNTILVVVAILFSNGCAKVGTISGGAKDIDPPVVVKSSPPEYALNFKGNKIRIDFDEYIQLKDANRQMNVSPPMKKKPLVWIKNKSIVVQFRDTLRDTTTYSLNFGNSISDNNENNPLPNYEFVFSTGNFLDSLGVRGRILDAFTLTPDKESLLAMLYNDLSDSAPMKKPPLFTSRTNKDGYFSINNIKSGKYALYALKDNNLNYKYDPLLEQFGFIDTFIVVNPEIVRNKPDDGYIYPPDTATTKRDTGKKIHLPDSLALFKARNSIHADIYTFLGQSHQQYIRNYERKDRHRLDIIFNSDLLYDSIELRPLYFKTADWYQLEFTNRKDSIMAWITDTSIVRSDTMRTIVSFWGTNKKGDTLWTSDTLNFRYTGNDKLKKGKKAKPETMKITSVNGQTADLNAPMVFEVQYPLVSIDYSKIEFKQKVDTIIKEVNFTLHADNIFYREIQLVTKWEEGANYEITFYPGAFKNVYDINHDTLKFKFSAQKLEFYGKLVINLSGIYSPVIVQLLDKDKVMYEKFTDKDGPVLFDYLQPKLYILKLIYDNNRDHEWTSGDFIKRKQAEKVIFYKEKINVRSNWDIDISWTP